MTGTQLVLQSGTVVPNMCSRVTLVLNVTVVLYNLNRKFFSILRFCKDLAYNK